MTTPGNVLLSLYAGGKAVPAKVASWVRDSVTSCASGIGKTLKRDEMERVLAAMYPTLPSEFLTKAPKSALCLLLGDEIVGRAVSDLCAAGIEGGPDTQKRLVEIAAVLTRQSPASLLPLPREALCALAAKAASTTQKAGVLSAVGKFADPLAAVDWNEVGARTSSALSRAARGGRAALGASKDLGGQILRSPLTRAAGRGVAKGGALAGRAALAGGAMAGRAALAGGAMAGRAALAGGALAGRAALTGGLAAGRELAEAGVRALTPSSVPGLSGHGMGQRAVGRRHAAWQAAAGSVREERVARIARALNPYVGAKKRTPARTARATKRDGNPYVGFGEAGYLGPRKSAPVGPRKRATAAPKGPSAARPRKRTGAKPLFTDRDFVTRLLYAQLSADKYSAMEKVSSDLGITEADAGMRFKAIDPRKVVYYLKGAKENLKKNITKKQVKESKLAGAVDAYGLDPALVSYVVDRVSTLKTSHEQEEEIRAIAGFNGVDFNKLRDATVARGKLNFVLDKLKTDEKFLRGMDEIIADAEERKDEEARKAATKIQGTVRGFLTRKKTKVDKEAAAKKAAEEAAAAAAEKARKEGEEVAAIAAAAKKVLEDAVRSGKEKETIEKAKSTVADAKAAVAKAIKEVAEKQLILEKAQAYVKNSGFSEDVINEGRKALRDGLAGIKDIQKRKDTAMGIISTFAKNKELDIKTFGPVLRATYNAHAWFNAASNQKAQFEKSLLESETALKAAEKEDDTTPTTASSTTTPSIPPPTTDVSSTTGSPTGDDDNTNKDEDAQQARYKKGQDHRARSASAKKNERSLVPLKRPRRATSARAVRPAAKRRAVSASASAAASLRCSSVGARAVLCA